MSSKMSSLLKNSQFWNKLKEFEVVFLAEKDTICEEIVTRELNNLSKSVAFVKTSDYDYCQLKKEIEAHTGVRPSLSRIFFNGLFIGTCDDVLQLKSKNVIQSLYNGCVMRRELNTGINGNVDYDLIIIGGGSAGLAAAKEAAKFGDRKIALFDFVEPSSQGTTWGIGGTCTNVGCIPKIMNHRAALLGTSLKHATEYGWNIPGQISHDWLTLKNSVNGFINSINFKDRVSLRSAGITYHNMLAQFVDSRTIIGTDKKGGTTQFTAENIIVAIGGRPNIPDIPGAREYGITSDDLFKLGKSPGKTLIVGASFIALECAGFLHGLGNDITVMVRSILLRGFDSEMSKLIGQDLVSEGIAFRLSEIPLEIIKSEESSKYRYRVRSVSVLTNEEFTGEYDTVLFAIGRHPNTSRIEAGRIGLKLDEAGKIYTNSRDETNISNVYALGDCCSGRPELTPFAIQAGRLLVRRLLSKSDVLCDYSAIPMTVFTPREFGTVGMAEDSAIKIFGADQIEVFHNKFVPSDYSFLENNTVECYLKIVCLKSDNNRILGMHYLGPNAGDVIQGFAVALRLGLTKEQMDDSIGIHPTCAEYFTTLSVTKSSGADIGEGGC